MKLYFVVMISFVGFFCIARADDDIRCKGIAFRCIPPPETCPENQTLAPGTCSCSCQTCRPVPAVGGVGSHCVVFNIKGLPTSNCAKGFVCCDNFCVKPEHCC